MTAGRYELRVAWRFLTAGRNQTALIVLGIAVGVAVQFFLSSLITGLQRSLIQRTVGSAPHIRVLPGDAIPQPLSGTAGTDRRVPLYVERDQILSWQSYVRHFRGVPGVTAVAAVVNGVGFVERGGASVSVPVKGVVPEDGFAIYKVDRRLTAGASGLSGDDVMIGATLAARLTIGPGDRFTLVNSRGGAVVCTVRGVFDLGTAEGNNLVLMHLDRARPFFGVDGVSAVEIQVADVFAAERIAEAERGSFARVRLESWQEKNRELLTALRSQSSSSDIIQFFVLFSITLGIASVLGISAMQKQRQLGILKAMGTTDRSAALIFLFQGLLLGVAGSLAGAAAGFGLVALFVNSVGGAVTFEFDVTPGRVLSPALFAIGASAVAALLPARRAAKLTPIEVIRYG